MGPNAAVNTAVLDAWQQEHAAAASLHLPAGTLASEKGCLLESIPPLATGPGPLHALQVQRTDGVCCWKIAADMPHRADCSRESHCPLVQAGRTPTSSRRTTDRSMCTMYVEVKCGRDAGNLLYCFQLWRLKTPKDLDDMREH